MANLQIDRVEAVSTVGIALVVKVIEGTVRVGDHATQLVSPAGERTEVDLRVQAISRYEHVEVDELEEHFAGVITFHGLYPNGIRDGWMLRT